MNSPRALLCLLMLCGMQQAHSQLYYTDIVSLQQAQQQYLSLQNNHIRQVSATSFNGNQPAENFALTQRISADGRTITITSNDPSSGESITTNTYHNGKLIMTRDSSANLKSVTRYEYDEAGKPTLIRTSTDDAFMNSHSEETHYWRYQNNLPASLMQVKNNNDTTFVSFTYDGGNVAGERWRRKGRITENYYYYYDSNNRLTDIVRLNIRVNKMLPDYLFEYDEQGRVTQMTQVPNGSSDYMLWKYVYNANGLKQRELLYNKQRELVGRIEYQYD